MRNATRFITAAVAAFGMTTYEVPTADAQFGGVRIGTRGVRGSIPGGAKRLREAESLIRNGQNARPRTYTQAADKVQAAIAKAESFLGQADKKLKGLGIQSGYKRVKQKRDLLAGDIAQDKILAVCGVAWNEVNGYHKQGKLAPDASLTKLDKAVAAFVKQAPKGFERSVKWWTKEAKRLRDENPIVAKRAKAKADRDAKRAADQAARAERDRRRKAFKGIDSVVNDMQTMARDYAGPIPAAKFADLDAQIANVKTVHAPAVHYYNERKRDFRIYNALVGAPGAVSKVLGGETVASGEVIGKKKLKITFKAQPNWCYLVLPAWKMWTKNERMSNINLVAKKGAGKVQGFWMRTYGKWMDAEGMCARGKLAVSYTADLKFAGTRNGIKYTVVGWPKATFPVAVAARGGLRRYDNCDPVEWESYWKDPIPGTVVWNGTEPYLVQYPANIGRYSSGNYWGINGSSSRFRGGLLLSPPKTRVSKRTFVSPKCSTRTARSKAAKSITKCWDTINAKYNKLDAKYDDIMDAPRSARAYLNARRASKNLDKKYEQWRKPCDKKQKALTKKWEKMFNGLVDWVVDEGPKDPLNVAAEWAKWREAATN